MIDWPAVIVFDGDTELTYVSGEDQWLNDAELHAMTYREGDMLVDTSGELFSLTHTKQGKVVPIAMQQQIELERFIRLVQVHAAACGECCIQKISFNDMAEGMQLVASIQS